LSILGWALVSGAVFLLRMQNEILQREIKRPWVVALAHKNSALSEGK
jgi:heme exporter protein C